MAYRPSTTNNSLITMLDLETGYPVRHIHRMLDERIAWIDVKPSATSTEHGV